MNRFKIPFDNQNAINNLSSEIINAKMSNNSINKTANSSRIFSIKNKLNNTAVSCIQIRGRKSKTAVCRLSYNLQEVINYYAKDKVEEDDRVRQAIKTIESNYRDSMNAMLNDMGCSDDSKDKITPSNVWTAMVDEGQLKVEQQRTINKHYFYVHGKCLTEPESKRSKVSVVFMLQLHY